MIAKTTATALAAATLFAVPVHAAAVDITVSNLQVAEGLFFTPFLAVFHAGDYDAFDPGASASPGVIDIAEEGAVGVERARAEGLGFQTAVVTGPDGFGSQPMQPPVIDPGESATIRIELDPGSEQYLTFLSMIIPSNDFFVGNADPRAYRLFDDAGAFVLSGPIEIAVGDVWDAGSEVNNGEGAAFSGIDPATEANPSARENGVVTRAGSLDGLLGLARAPGSPVGTVPTGGDTVFATVTVAAVPVPAGLPLLAGALGLMGWASRRRMRA